MDKKAIFHLALRDVLNIGPKDTKTKSITKARTGITKVRTDDRRRTVESIRGPPEITREQALKRVRTSLNEWYKRVYSDYENAWKNLSGVPLIHEFDEMFNALMEFESSDIEIALVLLLFEKKGWSVTHFRNGDSEPIGETPEWELWLKALLDNIMEGIEGHERVYRQVTPRYLHEDLRTFIRRTMNNFVSPKYDVETLLQASRMLTVIGNFQFEKQNTQMYFEEDADGIFDKFVDYLWELQDVIDKVEWTLNQLKNLAVSKYKKELDKQSKGEKAGFKLVWDLIEEVADLDTVFERNDGRLWVFNAIEKFIPEDDRETYHDPTPDQLQKMWDLFISNVMDNVKDKKLEDMNRILVIVRNLLLAAKSALLY
jgi:hypothetical protein